MTRIAARQDKADEAALVRHPITRQAIGVFDITSGYAEPATNIWALATQAASLVEREIQRLLSASDPCSAALVHAADVRHPHQERQAHPALLR